MPTTLTPPPAADTTGRCPWHAESGGQQVVTTAVQAHSQLLLPLHQRSVAQYAVNEAGRTELRLYIGDKEISFDEPELFAFGEQLVRQASFVAGQALAWGEGYHWPKLQPLLTTLVDEGVLRLLAEGDAAPPLPAPEGDRPDPLPPAPSRTPASWRDSAVLMQQLTGRPLEPGWLELVLPVFRVAHMALDAEGRQVGESNVFPPALRLGVPTRWRSCIYAGTRFQVDRPMNVSALKAMRAHWPLMMALLQPVRAAYLARYPGARQGWTVGHLERLSTAVLALATWPLVHERQAGVAQPLHPVLSSLFRVTDGLRMTMHQMLFVPIAEPTLSPDEPMDARRILDYAERNHSFHSEHGVCAGPRAMIEEFLAVLVDGQAPRHGHAGPLPEALQAVLADLPQAMDYGLLGLQAYAAVFSLWPAMTRCYVQIADAARHWAQASHAPAVQGLAQRLQGHLQGVQSSTYLATEDWRSHREQVYGDMWAQCGAGLATVATPLQAPLPTLLAEPGNATQVVLAQQLAGLLAQRFAGGTDTDAALAAPLAGHLAAYLLRTQAVLQVAVTTQATINRLLGRTPPQQPFTAADLNLHNLLQGALRPRLPYLPDELQQLLGLQLHIDAHTLRVDPTHMPAAAGHPDSTCMVQAEQRAPRT